MSDRIVYTTSTGKSLPPPKIGQARAAMNRMHEAAGNFTSKEQAEEDARQVEWAAQQEVVQDNGHKLRCNVGLREGDCCTCSDEPVWLF